jgi:anhydro-N-acetylmuramic acid kinase
MKKWKVIGLMSGSSLDGLDIAFCEFSKENGKWDFSIVQSETVRYSEKWNVTLKNIRNHTAEELLALHNDYGKLLGELTRDFLIKHNLKPDLISSHGHTVFHDPDKGYSFQLGNGQSITNVTHTPTVTDFRTGDILLGGQGAPLVPVGDELLFGEYDACLNIGGIANISFREKGNRKAYDVCPANQLLNHVAGELDMEYDKGGEKASSGKIIDELSYKLNHDSYYRKSIPKSLSNEYVRENFIEVIDNIRASSHDKLHTLTLHIAEKIAEAINLGKARTVLVTGGGAKNDFLIDKMQAMTKSRITIPDEKLVDFKESLIFAFMGLLRSEGQINCLASVTGASRDSSIGSVYRPN